VQVNDRLPSEAELSRRFEVSRPIVCEALSRLQALGLTEARVDRGTFVASNVTKLTITFGQCSASDLNEVRRCVEVPAARLAALRRTSEDIQLLASILGRTSRLPERRRPSRPTPGSLHDRPGDGQQALRAAGGGSARDPPGAVAGGVDAA
jgi:DNA-binding FadR family transcriptional regulator